MLADILLKSVREHAGLLDEDMDNDNLIPAPNLYKDNLDDLAGLKRSVVNPTRRSGGPLPDNRADSGYDTSSSALRLGGKASDTLTVSMNRRKVAVSLTQ